MAAGSTYTPIATTTLGSAASSVTFSAIAGTYTDLVLVISATQAATADNLSIVFNGVTTGNTYSSTVLSGNGTAAQSGRSINLNVGGYIDYNGYPPTGGTSPTATIVNVMNYANTTSYKTYLARANSAATGTDATVGLWRSISAITSVGIYKPNGNNISAGSTFTLYGIAAA